MVQIFSQNINNMIHFQLKDNKVHPIKDNMYAYLYGGYILQTGDLDGNF